MSLELWARATLTDENTHFFESLLCKRRICLLRPCLAKKKKKNGPMTRIVD